MQIKEHRLIQFIELYKSEFGVTLSQTEASAKASQLLRYALLCVKPLAEMDTSDIIIESNESE